MGKRSLRHRPAPADAPRPAERPSAPALPATPRWAWALFGGLLLLAYGNSLVLGLAVDAPYLLSNSRVASLTAENLRLIFTKPYWWPVHSDDLYRPVTLLSFALGGVSHPWTQHAMNLALHGLNVWLAFRLGWRLHGSPIAAGCLAALFTVHPVGTDAVTNIAGRADLLAAAAVLGGLLLHVRALEAPASVAMGWRAGLGLLAVLGFLSKENAVVLLPVLVLYDFVFGSVRRGWVSYAMVAAVFSVTAMARHAVLSDEMPHWQPFVDNPLVAAGFAEGRLTALGVLGWSTGLLLWPASLSADYSYDQIPVVGGARLAASLLWALALAAAVVFAWLHRRQRPAFFFWLLFFLGTRLPTANLLVIIGSVMAERFLYLPMPGFFGAIVALAWPAVSASGLAYRKAAAALFAAVLLALCARTIVRNRDWKDDESIWRAAIAASPDSYKPYKGLARVMTQRGLHDEAIGLFERSLAVMDKRPLPPADRSSDLLLGAGEAYLAKADSLMAARRDAETRVPYEKARALLLRAAETDRATNERVRALRERREPAADIQDVGIVRIHHALGTVALHLEDLDTATAAFEWQRHVDPTHAAAYLGLARTASRSGRPADEAMLLLEAMILEPESPEVWKRLPAVAAREGIRGLGIEGGRPRVDPADPALAALAARACTDLAATLRRAGRHGTAMEAESICARNLGYRGPGKERP
jgi:tetratricopeptide (TPR) repeat protein